MEDLSEVGAWDRFVDAEGYRFVFGAAVGAENDVH